MLRFSTHLSNCPKCTRVMLLDIYDGVFTGHWDGAYLEGAPVARSSHTNIPIQIKAWAPLPEWELIDKKIKSEKVAEYAGGWFAETPDGFSGPWKTKAAANLAYAGKFKEAHEANND